MSPEPDEHPVWSARRVHALAAVLAVAALALWAWHAWRARFLCDDAFISFRYADHLARGLGLVWNAGERVEGYTNFLWVLGMAAGLRLGLAPELLSQWLGCASALALLAALFLAGGGGPAGRLRGALMALLLAASGSFGAWSTSGLETMFFALLVWLGTWRFLLERREEARAPFVSALLLASAVLTRPDGALFAGLAGLMLLGELLRGRVAMRAFAAWVAALGLPVGLHLAYRLWFYGDWLPNTFRAKVPGAWLEQGLDYLALYQRHYHALYFLPLCVLALCGARRREAGLLLAGLAGTLLYVVTVGGDRFEFRFLIVVLPHFTWLVVEGAWTLARARPRAGRPLAAAALLALLVLTLRGYRPRAGERNGVATIAAVKAYAERRAYEGRLLRSWIERGSLPRELVLCVGGAGAVPYYTRWTTVDRRGLNDAWIARQPLPERGLIAHERDAPHAYLVERRVAVFDYRNNLVLTREAFLRGKPVEHDGHPLRLRALELDGLYFTFATFIPDEELAALFPGQKVLAPEE